jgi:hypothetical protein
VERQSSSGAENKVIGMSVAVKLLMRNAAIDYQPMRGYQSLQFQSTKTISPNPAPKNISQEIPQINPITKPT